MLSFNLHDHLSLCSLVTFQSFVIPCKNFLLRKQYSFEIMPSPHKTKGLNSQFCKWPAQVMDTFSDLAKDICLWEEGRDIA